MESLDHGKSTPFKLRSTNKPSPAKLFGLGGIIKNLTKQTTTGQGLGGILGKFSGSIIGQSIGQQIGKSLFGGMGGGPFAWRFNKGQSQSSQGKFKDWFK
tara:strand:+ start:1713 stop:2012 length:300 start_codon:yes stop_codon:yes gene_type:complete